MKIILKEDITNLGYKDDVVEVKSGYGRNYLIPFGKAVIATPAALKVLAENQRQRAHKLAKIKADAEALAASLKDVKLTIGAKTSSTGTIFGSVNAIQIAEALEKLGYDIHKSQVRTPLGAIKAVGEYPLQIDLHHDIVANVNVQVVAEA